jgi:hypothetical protein
VVKASGMGIGAYVGFVAAGSGPLLLITVPAGMIICGAAAGIGKAIEDGLYQRILKMMGVTAKVPTRARTRRRVYARSAATQKEIEQSTPLQVKLNT